MSMSIPQRSSTSNFDFNRDGKVQGSFASTSLQSTMDSRRTRRPRKSVSFSPTSRLYLYVALEPEDERDMWYTEDDKERSKANARRDLFVIKQLQRGESPQDYAMHREHPTSVGLEKWLVPLELVIKRERLKRDLFYQVLMEQAGDAEDKAERIADVATKLTTWMVDLAEFFGEHQRRESKV